MSNKRKLDDRMKEEAPLNRGLKPKSTTRIDRLIPRLIRMKEEAPLNRGLKPKSTAL